MQVMAEDIKINEVQQVKDATYITVVLEDGSLGKIPRQDLIELIRENMPESNSAQKGLASPGAPKCYDYKNVNCKLSDLTENGFYFIDDKILREDAPSNLTNYCLIVFNDGFVVQLLHDWEHHFFIRSLWGTWSSWRQISLL